MLCIEDPIKGFSNGIEKFWPILLKLLNVWQWTSVTIFNFYSSSIFSRSLGLIKRSVKKVLSLSLSFLILVMHTYSNVNCNNQIMLKDCFNSKQFYWKRICIAVLCCKQLARDQLSNCILHYLQPVEGKFTAVSYIASLIWKHCVWSIQHSPASLQHFFFFSSLQKFLCWGYKMAW